MPVNILYINHYASGPSYGMEYRPYYLAREWVRAGVAANFSRVRARQHQAGELNANRKAQMDRVDRLYRELLS